MNSQDVTCAIAGNKLKAEDWADISNSEEYRVYEFYENGGLSAAVTIYNPTKLNIKRKPEGDSHRVQDKFGRVHYIPAGWRHLYWVPIDSNKPADF